MVFILSVLYDCAGDFGIRSLRHASHHTSRSSMARFYLSDGHIFAWRPPAEKLFRVDEKSQSFAFPAELAERLRLPSPPRTACVSAVR